MNRIPEAFLKELQETPYSAVTVAGICRRAGISRATFYRRYSCKQDCLRDAVAMHLAASHEGSRSGDLGCYFRYWQQHRTFLELIGRERLYPELVEGAVDFVRRQGHGDTHRIRFIVTGVFCILVQWVRDGCQEPPEQLARCLEQLMSAPLAEQLMSPPPRWI